MDNCIFCKIASGEIPSATLFENEEFRVILDLNPASKGHALILPKMHASDLFDLPDETAAKAMVLAKQIAQRLKEGLNGYTLCSGIICEELNGPDYTVIPFAGDGSEGKMEIGYIVRKNAVLTEIGNCYVDELKRYLSRC